MQTRNLLFFGSLQCSNSVSGKLDFDVFSNSELNAIVLESNYRTVNSTRSDDLIPRLQVINHFLKLFLPAAGR